MCTVQNPTATMAETLSWKDRVMASVDKTSSPKDAQSKAKPATSSPEIHRASKPRGVSSHGKGMNGVQKNDTSYAMRRKKKTKSTVPRQHMLNSTWTLYYHNPTSNDWTNASYKKVSKIVSVESFCAHYKALDFPKSAQGMFFLMRGDIMPTWEDKHNQKGGCWSFKVSHEHFFSVFKNLSILLVGESISRVPLLLNGISVSPKRGFCIIKLWNHNSKYDNTKVLHIGDVSYLEDNGPALYTAFQNKK